MSKAITKEELRDQFIDAVKGIGYYWLNDERTPDIKDKIEGIIFSLFILFDGCLADMPAFDIVVRPHPDDKQYAIDNEKDYYIDGMCLNDDIMLHEIKER